MTEEFLLPRRDGSRPGTTTVLPHSQADQQPTDNRFLSAVLTEAATWPGVVQGGSAVALPGARALHLTEDVATGPAEALMVGREFCHGHSLGDHSLHTMLPLPLADEAEAAGWAERHLLALTGQIPRTTVMLYAPRNDHEAAVVLSLVRASYDFARGILPVPS